MTKGLFFTSLALSLTLTRAFGAGKAKSGTIACRRTASAEDVFPFRPSLSTGEEGEGHKPETTASPCSATAGAASSPSRGCAKHKEVGKWGAEEEEEGSVVPKRPSEEEKEASYQAMLASYYGEEERKGRSGE